MQQNRHHPPAIFAERRRMMTSEEVRKMENEMYKIGVPCNWGVSRTDGESGLFRRRGIIVAVASPHIMFREASTGRVFSYLLSEVKEIEYTASAPQAQGGRC